jgi:3-hydroxy-9,10-secoandrosta-1,3,5(10)-triene-9,17-dione monooxygenase
VSFAGVSYDEAMRRAREIVPTLRERAQKCEDERVLLPENEKLLHDTGLFRFHQPRRFGGWLPFVAVVDTCRAARGCPRPRGTSAPRLPPRILGYYEPETQHEPGTEPDVIAFDRSRGRQGQKRRTGSSSAGWPFSSGSTTRLEHARGHHLRR